MQVTLTHGTPQSGTVKFELCQWQVNNNDGLRRNVRRSYYVPTTTTTSDYDPTNTTGFERLRVRGLVLNERMGRVGCKRLICTNYLRRERNERRADGDTATRVASRNLQGSTTTTTTTTTTTRHCKRPEPAETTPASESASAYVCTALRPPNVFTATRQTTGISYRQV